MGIISALRCIELGVGNKTVIDRVQVVFDGFCRKHSGSVKIRVLFQKDCILCFVCNQGIARGIKLHHGIHIGYQIGAIQHRNSLAVLHVNKTEAQGI